MITPISNVSDNSFRGIINDSKLLQKSLEKFKPEELAEFNAIRNKAAKVNDKKVFDLFCDSNSVKNNNSKINTYNMMLVDMSDKVILSRNQVGCESEFGKIVMVKSIVKTILEPLREIYK